MDDRRRCPVCDREMHPRARCACEMVAAVCEYCGAHPDDIHADECDELRLRAELARVTAERDEARRDVVVAAGECLVDLPEPGTDLARVLAANNIMRRERDEAQARVAELEAVAEWARGVYWRCRAELRYRRGKGQLAGACRWNPSQATRIVRELGPLLGEDHHG